MCDVMIDTTDETRLAATINIMLMMLQVFAAFSSYFTCADGFTGRCL